MDETMHERLEHSILRFGFVVPLVVRKAHNDTYETIGGAQRLSVLQELGYQQVPCVVLSTDDTNSQLLTQTLNHISGEDDLGLRSELLRNVLESLPQDEVLSLLPETSQSLAALASLGTEDMASHLQAWQEAQGARLRHMTIQLAPHQVDTVEAALESAGALSRGNATNPNKRGDALYALCADYLRKVNSHE
jgi:ParB family chromosome partitioning protein